MGAMSGYSFVSFRIGPIEIVNESGHVKVSVKRITGVLLLFKITYEWERYSEKHEEEIKKDQNLGMSSYIFENRKLFSLLYKKGLIIFLMRVFETLVPGGEVVDKNMSYLMAFFTYGYFGIIYQWIKYDFDETPEQIKAHIEDTILSAAKST
jgi:hypothetical protein